MQFDARLGEYKYVQICRPLYKRLTPYAYWSPFLLMTVGLGAYVGAVILNQKFETNDFKWLGFFGFALIVLSLVVRLYRFRKQWKSTDSAPYRQGVTTISVDDSGIGLENALSSLHYRWGAIVDVIEGKEATLILVGGLEAIAIPDHTLPDDLSAETFRDKLRRYLPR